MKKRRRGYRWSFSNMHPVLQIISFIVAGIAFIGWSIAGIWYLYFIMHI